MNTYKVSNPSLSHTLNQPNDTFLITNVKAGCVQHCWACPHTLIGLSSMLWTFQIFVNRAPSTQFDLRSRSLPPWSRTRMTPRTKVDHRNSPLSHRGIKDFYQASSIAIIRVPEGSYNPCFSPHTTELYNSLRRDWSGHFIGTCVEQALNWKSKNRFLTF